MITLEPFKGPNPPGNDSDGWDEPLVLGDDEIAVEDPEHPGRYKAEKINKEMDMVKLAKSNDIWKDDEKRLVFGWANVVSVDGATVLDRQNDMIDDQWEMEKAAYDFVLNSRVGGDMHLVKGVSTMVESMVFTDEKCDALGLSKSFPRGWWVGFRVNNEGTWNLIKSGEYTGFSVHGTGQRTEVTLDQVAFTEIGKAASLTLDRFKALQHRLSGGPR
jgi:hypothetical protein